MPRNIYNICSGAFWYIKYPVPLYNHSYNTVTNREITFPQLFSFPCARKTAKPYYYDLR